MNKDRLLILADALEEQHHQQPEKFSFLYWHCGTTYCAFGLAALLPVFNKAGLHFVSENKIVLDGFSVLYRHDVGESFDSYNNRRVAAKFFELALSEVNDLFLPGYVLSEKTNGLEVARLIRYFVKNETVKGFKSPYGASVYKELVLE